MHAAHVVSPLHGLTKALERTGGSVSYYDGADAEHAAMLARHADACVTVLATSAEEHRDRDDLSLPQNEVAVARAVRAVRPDCVAVVVAPGAVLTDWADDFGALLLMFMPGQEVSADCCHASVPCAPIHPSKFMPSSLEESAAWAPGVGEIARNGVGAQSSDRVEV